MTDPNAVPAAIRSESFDTVATGYGGDASVTIRRVMYLKERYALGLRIRRNRLSKHGHGERGACGYYLKDPDRVVASMVKAIRRHWRDAPYIVVDTKAHDYMICKDHTDSPYVVVVVDVFRNINPVHRDELQAALGLPATYYETLEVVK